MKRNALLFCSAIILMVTLACSGEDNEPDPVVPNDNEQGRR